MNIATGVDFVGREFPHVLRPSLVLTGRHKAKNWITDLDARIKEALDNEAIFPESVFLGTGRVVEVSTKSRVAASVPVQMS